MAATRVLVLGAGFGGLELSSRLARDLGEEVDVTLIDRNDAFVFGFSKLDLMFGQRQLSDVRIPYSELRHPSIHFHQETITEIDPANRRVKTNGGAYDGDVLVVALGADYNVDGTPGLTEAGHEFYSVAGAERLAEVLRAFAGGRVVIGVLGQPFKCPPAPSEAAFMTHDFLTAKGVRESSSITLIFPMGRPIPPSAPASAAIVEGFRQRGIEALFDCVVTELDPQRKVARINDGTEVGFDLFLGIPKHRVPDVVAASGMAVDGWIPVDAGNLSTRFEGVYAVGDVTSVGTPKAGMFAERAAGTVADTIIAKVRGLEAPPPFDGRGICYVEMGEGDVGRVDVAFLDGPGVKAEFTPPSEETRQEKDDFAAVRREHWFG
ncbi:MAG TPA: FAD-dependent oxidoreductase [Candidatus Dormibacteraeota bacterium]